MSPGVSQAQGAAVAEAGVPHQGQVDALKLGQAQVLSPPRLDVLHTENNDVRRLILRVGCGHEPINNDRSSEHMRETEDVELLKALSRLAGE